MDFNHNKKEEPFYDSSILNTMIRAFSKYDMEELLKQSFRADADHRSHTPAGGIFSAADGVVFGNDDSKSYGADGFSPDLAVQYRNHKLGDIVEMTFGGRYVILLMSLFSIYTGLIYNEFFSVPFELFGASAYACRDASCSDSTTVGLVKVRDTYPFGVDPSWHGTRSELPFLNSLKMKMSILIGVAQMNLGIILSFFNALYFRNGLNICYKWQLHTVSTHGQIQLLSPLKTIIRMMSLIIVKTINNHLVLHTVLNINSNNLLHLFHLLPLTFRRYVGFTPQPATTQPAPKLFVPTTPPIMRNADQYQQPPSMGSQFYPSQVNANSNYQVGPPAPGSLGPVPSPMVPTPGQKISQDVAPTPQVRGFMPMSNTGVQRTTSGQVHPPSSTQSAGPPAPPPTVQTADVSNVPAQQRPVISTLMRLFTETSEAMGGSHAIPAKKREIDDNSKKLGALFAKLNSGDISKNAAEKLVQLCQALDRGDFPTALKIQVDLTTSDWDECSFWLATLKRMIKIRQTVR